MSFRKLHIKINNGVGIFPAGLERIARNPSKALGAAKKVLNASEDISFKNGYELEALAGNLWRLPATHIKSP